MATLTETIQSDRNGPVYPLAIETDNDNDANEWNYPEGGGEAWTCLLGSFALMVPSFGFQTAIGSVQDYISTNQLANYKISQVGWISAMLVFITLFLGVQVGPLFDRYGARYLLIAGCASSFLSYMLLAQSYKYWHFILSLSICGGVSSAVITTIAISAPSHWFHRRRAFASGVCLGGSSFGGMILPLSLRYAFPRFGWTWSIRMLAFIALACYAVGITFVKARQPPRGRTSLRSTIDLRAFATVRLTCLALAVFAFEFIIFGCAALLPTYVRYSGFSFDTQFYALTVLNGCSFLGRAPPGIVADKLGRFNVLLILIMVTLVTMATVWLPVGSRSEATLYAVVALFGFGSGGLLSLAPVCAGQLCRTEEYGRFYGTIYAVASFGVLTTVPLGGFLLQSTTPQVVIGFYSAMLVLGLLSVIGSRWALLDWKWQWKVKI